MVPRGISASGSRASAIMASSGASKLGRMPKVEAGVNPKRG
jgi:hypothetical protein